MSETTQQTMNETNGEIRPASDTTASNAIVIAGTTLKITPNGLNKLWSLTGSMEIPLDHVAGATVDPGFTMSARKAIRTPGLSLPGKKAGTFTFLDGDVEFWNIAQPEQPLVIQLRDEKFDRLVLGVADPRQTADAINEAI